MRNRTTTVTIVGLALLLGVNAAQAQLGSPVTEMRPLHPSAELETRDWGPSLATDGNGTWIVVWMRSEPSCGIYTDRLVAATSFDDGLTWTEPVPIDATGHVETNSNIYYPPSIAGDGNGNWIVTWVSSNQVGGPGSFRNILAARSTDDGLTWSMPVRASGLETDVGADYAPSLATDGNGQWIVVWHVSATTYPQPLEPDIYFARSQDNGATWSDPGLVNTDGADDARSDWSPRIASDGDDTWIVTWYATGTGPTEIYCSRSIGGTAWSAPRLLSGADDGYFPEVATDGVDWMILWTVSEALGSGPDTDVVAVTSTDGGFNWPSPTLVNTDALVDAENDGLDSVSSDGLGNWVVALDSTGAPGNSTGTDRDLLVTRSGDLGTTWSDPEPFNSDAAIDDTYDYRSSLAADGRGNWRAVWIKANRARTAMFRLPFPSSCATDQDGDGYGAPGDSACPMGAATDCDDSDFWVGPQVPDVCDGVNNDCDDPLWPSLSGLETDDDGDGLTECAGDCRDDDDGVIEPPGAVSLTLAADGNHAELQWSVPSPSGGSPTALVYDVLRNDGLPFCQGDDLCLAANQSGLTASDDEVPPQGDVFFYLVRAENSCGRGPLGASTLDSAVTNLRIVVDCP